MGDLLFWSKSKN